jgi:hypothetical protein
VDDQWCFCWPGLGGHKAKIAETGGFTGVNSSQLLEVTTMVFVNQDQEIKWEVNRKMKRKVDLLVAALVGQ